VSLGVVAVPRELWRAIASQNPETKGTAPSFEREDHARGGVERR